MDYKEKYQKAHDRAKQGLLIDEVFPKLKETKDERIKREIIEYIEAFANAKNEKIPTEWLDWLEKHKEQKPVHTAKEMWKEMRLEVYAQASGNRHEPNYSDDSTKMFSLCDIDEIFEKIGNSTVGSQPAEWNEEDNRHINTIIRAIHGAGNITPIEGELAEKWFKSLRSPWKPSQEQIDALEHFIRSWGESGTMSPQNTILCATKSLLNDLKKQM